MKELLLMQVKEPAVKALDSYLAATLSIIFSLSFLELAGKVLGALLAVILCVRGFVNMLKAFKDRDISKETLRKTRVERKIAERKLKKLEEQDGE